MELLSIVTGLRRHKATSALIALQVALTLCIVSNALFVVHDRLVRIDRPTGIDEADFAMFRNEWLAPQGDLKARIQGDLAVLRSAPGVADAYATNGVPLYIGGGAGGVGLKPNQETPSAYAAEYIVDDHAMKTLGIRLTEGRWFTAAEIVERHNSPEDGPPIVIITRALATKLFPAGQALGSSIYVGKKASSIIGIVERLVTPLLYGVPAQVMDSFFENSILLPGLLVENSYLYVIRATPGHRDAALLASQRLLAQHDRARGIDLVHTFPAIRAESYKTDRSLASLLSLVCAMLLLVTGLGIVGLASYWVGLRRSPIGIRRALGARRVDIVRYFQIENVLIVGCGAAVGLALAVATNLWMVQKMALPRMGAHYAIAGAAIVLILGQLAVLWPARRAASIPPARATRAV
ncbi:MAG TPA: FtsX-like permease family protein [Steroidobacteraceae bacterium]